MSGLQKYNQRILAVLGTLAMMGLGGLLIVAGIEIAEEIYDSWQSRQRDNAVVINKPAEDKPPMRNQAISFGSPYLIDTLAQRYLIPVSQVNLEKPERIQEDRSSGFLSTKMAESGKAYYASGDVNYNNFLIYDKQQNTRTPVFQQRTSVHRYEVIGRDTIQYLLMEGTQRDTNQDGRLDANDLQALFIYQLETKQLHAFAPAQLGLESYYLTHESDEVIARFRQDKNGDGEADYYHEPIVLRQLSLQGGPMQDFVPEALQQQLQQWVDGTK